MPESSLDIAVSVESIPKRMVRVLYVDDDPGFLDVAKRCLEIEGDFQVETACSVDEAMEKMKAATFDVIVSDYQMPEKDGLVFLEELRASGGMPPFILFTGKGREEVAVRALNLGAFRYVSKNGDPKTVFGELSSGIRQASEQACAQERLRESEERSRARYIVATQEELRRMLEKAALLNEKLNVTGSLTRHDIRNKLSAINGYAYLAKQRSADNPEILGFLRQIEEVTKSIAKILDFAKTYEMLGKCERTYMDIGKMIEEAASLFADLKGVRIVNECRGIEVLADSLVMEVFHNLIDNSLKYGEKIGQIKVYSQKNRDGTTDLIYEDDGVGIEQNMKNRLFQKGFGKGTGYGLYLIKRICELYGWDIQEKGQPGKGVRFIIRIPTTIGTNLPSEDQATPNICEM